MKDTPIAATVQTGPQWPGLALLVLCLAVLVAQIDTAVVNLATRPIGTEFKAGISALQWVMDSYNLVYAVLLLTGGLLADLYGRRLIFMTGVATFTAASVLCALAPTIGVLILARALAGLGAALLLPASLAIIRVTWPVPAERARVLGIWAACNGVAMAVGPTLGGLLIRGFGWRSIFGVVVPFGLLALALALPAISESSDPQDRDFDMSAQLLAALTLGGVSLAAIEAGERPALAVVAFIVAMSALVLFVRVEHRRGAGALVPLDLFTVPAFLGAIIATTGMTFGMYGVLFLLPLTWLGGNLLDATGAGLALMPMALIFLCVSSFSNRIERLLGTRVVTSGGLAVIAFGLAVIAGSSAAHPLWPAEIGLALTGVGMGVATGPLMGAAIGAVVPARAGTASALINVARMAGATLGVAVLGSLYTLDGKGLSGLRLAMLTGAAVQISAAAFSTWCNRAEPDRERRPE